MPGLAQLFERIPTGQMMDGVSMTHRFLVVFFMRGILPNPLDIRFESVSGLSSEVTLETVQEGGQNLYSQRLPTRVQYGNLVLKRGRVQASALNIEFNLAMSLFRFAPGNVLVSPLSQEGHAISGWLFLDAYPVRWSTGDLDATRNDVLVDTMELAYQRYQAITL